jgi:hypothetical protein
VSQSAGRRTAESNRPVLFQADGRVSSGGCALGRRACYRSPAVVFVSVRGPVGLWIERERGREKGKQAGSEAVLVAWTNADRTHVAALSHWYCTIKGN